MVGGEVVEGAGGRVARAVELFGLVVIGRSLIDDAMGGEVEVI